MQLTFQLFLQKFNYFIELILPAQCLLCHLPSNNRLICKYCQKALINERPCCQHCGLSLPKSLPFCGECLQHAHFFTQLHALADYHPPYPAIIKKFKYAKKLIYGELLAELLIQSIANNISNQQISEIDYLLPVPLHKQKQQQRGFNQAQLLAQKIGENFNLPLLLDAIQRQKETVAQEGLSLQKRKKNLENAFILSRHQKIQLSGAYIVIIDDVVTTGATVDSLCKLLLQVEVKRIDVWCICRTGLTIHHHK